MKKAKNRLTQINIDILLSFNYDKLGFKNL